MENAPVAAVLERRDAHPIGHGAIDRTHQEFSVLLVSYLSCLPQTMAVDLQGLLAHMEEHFALEEQLMETYVFPPRDCHADEHNRVLASVREVLIEVQAGDYASGRELGVALGDWFVGHVDYMDASLSTWISKKTWGGAPVVVRRSTARKQAVCP